MVEAEDHAGVDVLGGADALAEREARLVDELADDPAEHEAGRVADPLDVAAERGEERLGGARGGVRGRRAARQLDEPAERDGGEEAGRAALRVELGERRLVAQHELRAALQR